MNADECCCGYRGSACTLGFPLKIFQDHEIVSEKEGVIKSPPDLKTSRHHGLLQEFCVLKILSITEAWGVQGTECCSCPLLNIDDREMVSRCNI